MGKTWLPELRGLSAREAHLIPIRSARSIVADEVDWPEPVVDPLKQLSWEDQKGLGRLVAGSSEHEARAPEAHGKGKGAGKGKFKGGKAGLVPQVAQIGCSGSKTRRWQSKAMTPSETAIGG